MMVQPPEQPSRISPKVRNISAVQNEIRTRMGISGRVSLGYNKDNTARATYRKRHALEVGLCPPHEKSSQRRSSNWRKAPKAAKVLRERRPASSTHELEVAHKQVKPKKDERRWIYNNGLEGEKAGKLYIGAEVAYKQAKPKEEREWVHTVQYHQRCGHS